MRPPRDATRPDRLRELEQENTFLREGLEKALAEIERLRKALEEALRATKRQAAPFSKGEPKPNPQRPGRKPGARYGQRASRPVPAHVDEAIHVPLPPQCRRCGGSVVHTDTQPQFQEDIVRRTLVRRFDVEVGQCAGCGRHVQGRHPLQTSAALGAAQVQVGPEALALAAHLNKELGLSHERMARVLALGYGLQVSRSTLCRALTRLGAKAAATYDRLRAALRESPVAWEDETGWRVAGWLEWLWVGVSPAVTVYDILPGRGFAEAAALLGEDYDGVLHHDGWRPYYRFLQATHQSCVSHVLRRCRDLVKSASPSAARLPRAIMDLLQQALALRDRYRDGKLSRHGLAVATGRLEASMDRWLDKPYRSAPNRRLAKHLSHERPHLFTFLRCPGGIHATNNAAERALRPAVVARKTWGGNRTHQGAETQKILASVLRTCRQQGKEAFGRLTALLRSPHPVILDIVPASHSP